MEYELCPMKFLSPEGVDRRCTKEFCAWWQHTGEDGFDGGCSVTFIGGMLRCIEKGLEKGDLSIQIERF